jgi:hypothetical protein
MPELHGRALMEARFGPLGAGAQRISIAGIEYDIPTLLSQIGAQFDDAKPVDVLQLPDRYVVRYLDAQDQRVVALEFDADFRCLGEIRAHIAEWEGDQAYFTEYSGH